MVEYNITASYASPLAARALDSVFGSLADATRRDMLRRVAAGELSVSAIAANYTLTLAAISKHLKVLEKAQLIKKRRQGKEMIVSLAPGAFRDADEYLLWYRQRMEQRFEAFDEFIKQDNLKK